MSDHPTTAPRQPHTVSIKIEGQSIEIPWGFKSPLREGKAAKFHGIEYPATSSGKAQE